MKKLLSLLLLLLSSILAAQAQEAIPMADALRADGKIWVVIATILIVFSGFIVYLVRLDGKISRLEADRKKQS